MAIFKIKDGFSIVDSNNVESQQISGIATAISNNPSHTKIPTEKAVADAIAGGGGGGSDSPADWQVGYPNSSFNPDSTGGMTYIACVWGGALPSVIKSFSVWPYSNPYALGGFSLWIGIYDRTADTSPLVSSFTWDNSKHPSTNWQDTEATFNFDAPVSINREHFYRIAFHYHHPTLYGSMPFISVMSPAAASACKEWGTNTTDGNHELTPPPTYTWTGTWSTVNQMPWFRVNAWAKTTT